MKIKTIEHLREHAIETLEKLAAGKIDANEAGVTGKLCENVISTVKAELEYAKMLRVEPKIDFLGDLSKRPKIIEHKPDLRKLK